ncbi:MAG: methylated-DNA--[protein]-cysteine S-methyltransferase [Verrucomicrobiota bacterium]
MNDYERVARVIRCLGERYLEQPTLEDMASAAGLSVSRLHRLFSEWAGVTPKSFVQALTYEHARRMLREGETVLDTSLEVGLSGPGRLHDLCVSFEALSPGELKRGGEGIEVTYGFSESLFGDCLVAETDRGLSHLSFVSEGGREALVSRVRRDWPRAGLRRSDELAEVRVAEIFTFNEGDAARGCGRGLNLLVRGTSFRVQVWRALLRIPEGQITSYGRVARSIGSDGASRAVGAAVGANPVAYLIPCHRVIRETGALGGYRWGLERKRVMLALEVLGE